MPQARQRPQPRRAIAARRAGMMWTRLGATFLTGAGLFALFGGYCFATRSLHVQPLRTRVRPETQTQAPAASGCPTLVVGVVTPSVVYLTGAVDAQTVASRAPAGIVSGVGESGARLCWPGANGV